MMFCTLNISTCSRYPKKRPLSVYFDDNLIEEIEEHYSYRFISFVCDVGGNFGFFLGLSILTAFQIGESVIVYAFETIRSKLKKIKPPQLVPHLRTFAYKSLQFLLISSCAVACSYQTYDRLNFFLSGPSETKVSLIRNSSVKFPSTTMCPSIGNYGRLVEGRIQKAKERKLNNFCDVHPFALLDDTRNISTIWDLMSGSRIFVKTNTRTMLGTCNTYSYENLVHFQKDDFLLIFLFHNIQRCIENSLSLFMIHDDNEIVTYKPANEFEANKPAIGPVYGFSAKRFKILNRVNRPCDTNTIVNKCKKNCFENALKNISRCRLPLTSLPEIPLCADENDALVAYNQLLHLTASFNYFKRCNCPKICDEIIYTKHRKFISNWLNIYFDDNAIEEIEEYYSYNLVSLMCDFGGNLGLFLGLSILALFQLGESFVAYAFKTIHSKMNKIKPSQLVTTFQNNSNRKTTTGFPDANSKRGFVYKFLRFLIISLSTIACSYQIYDQFNFFLSRPIETKVSLIRNSSFKFPSITLCPPDGDYIPLVELRRQKSIERNFSHFCDVHPLTLINDTFNISTIWTLMSVNGTLNLTDLPTIPHKTDIEAVRGTCNTYSHKKLVQNDDLKLIFSFKNNLSLCDDKVITFMLHNDDDIMTYKPLTGFKSHKILTEVSYVQDFESNQDPVRYKSSCKRMREKLLRKLPEKHHSMQVNKKQRQVSLESNCRSKNNRLPLTSFSELPLCANGEEALVAYNQLRHLSVSFNYFEQCKCPKICDEMIYTDRLKMIDSKPTDPYLLKFYVDVTLLTLYFDDDVIEEIVEKYNYSFVSFIGNVGGNLGLFLGLSIPGLFQLAESVIVYSFKKITNLTK
uniref:Uncharacterized protein n=1 Tax=Strigamia maritima TaxID=126957 RepID=T1IU28_STRMM